MWNRWMAIAGIVWGLSGTDGFAETGNAVIHPTSEGSSIAGHAILVDMPGGLALSVQVTGLSPGTHGIHIHQYGDCGDQGNAAGGHFNPAGIPHGFLPSDGLTKAHPGDMGNLEIGSDGSGSLSLVLPGVTLTTGTYSVAGRAIVLHEKPDDFGQPTGNAGGRIGCGTIFLSK